MPETCRLPQRGADQRERRRAERKADTELARAFADAASHRAINADSGQHHAGAGEEADQQEVEAVLCSARPPDPSTTQYA